MRKVAASPLSSNTRCTSGWAPAIAIRWTGASLRSTPISTLSAVESMNVSSLQSSTSCSLSDRSSSVNARLSGGAEARSSSPSTLRTGARSR